MSTDRPWRAVLPGMVVAALAAVGLATVVARAGETGQTPTPTPATEGAPPPVEMYGIKDEISSLDSSATELRSVIKWIATAFGALGAILIGTTPLAGLRAIGWSLSVIPPLAFGIIAIVAAGYIVWRSTDLLAPRQITLNDVFEKPEFAALRNELGEEDNNFLGAWGPDVPTFRENLRTENAALANMNTIIYLGADEAAVAAVTAERPKVARRIEAISQVSARLLRIATFRDLCAQFDATKARLFAAAFVVFAGIIGLVMTVSLAPKTAESAVPQPAMIQLTDKGEARTDALLGDECPDAFKGLVTSGGTSGPWDILVVDPACRSGTIRLTKDDASVLAVFGE